MNENNSKKNRPKSQIMMPNTTSPLPSQQGRKNGSSDSLPNHRYENEWEVRGVIHSRMIFLKNQSNYSGGFLEGTG